MHNKHPTSIYIVSFPRYIQLVEDRECFMLHLTLHWLECRNFTILCAVINDWAAREWWSVMLTRTWPSRTRTRHSRPRTRTRPTRTRTRTRTRHPRTRTRTRTRPSRTRTSTRTRPTRTRTRTRHPRTRTRSIMGHRPHGFIFARRKCQPSLDSKYNKWSACQLWSILQWELRVYRYLYLNTVRRTWPRTFVQGQGLKQQGQGLHRQGQGPGQGLHFGP